MFLIDTNVISEARKGRCADPGVQSFWVAAARDDTPLFLAAVTIGELRRGVELIRHRGDHPQAQLLEQLLAEVLQNYGDRLLDLDADAAQILGRPRAGAQSPQRDPQADRRQCPAAKLTVVTRNSDDFSGCGVRLLNSFQAP
jgi:predicted nucleic acid-binding protein